MLISAEKVAEIAYLKDAINSTPMVEVLLCILAFLLSFGNISFQAKLVSEQEAIWASRSAELERISVIRLIREDWVCDSYNNILENEVAEVADSLLLEKYYPGITPTNEHTFSCLLGQKILAKK